MKNIPFILFIIGSICFMVGFPYANIVGGSIFIIGSVTIMIQNK